ncbi:MAG TPA: hypothetical protein EYN67_06085 [Flavobacteriales bacterium]|nr:hypothetical protein [Flavobacteriales bacterium]
MSQNLAIANADNLVVLNFVDAFLSTATDIKVIFGAETYTKLLNPTIVIVDSDTQLSLNLSDTAEVGKIFVTIKRFDGGSVYGSDITSRELGNLDQIVVAIGTQLIIEDGSVVANANSWVTDAEYKAFAKLKGYSIPATQPDREANLANAYDFINFTYEQQLQGWRVTPQTQTGCMPRTNIYAYDVLVANDSIPQDFKNAQMLASFSINDGVDTNAVKDSADLAGFSVGQGAYSETYQAGSSTPTLAQMPAVSKVLKPYTNAGLNGGGLYRENMGYLG